MEAVRRQSRRRCLARLTPSWVTVSNGLLSADSSALLRVHPFVGTRSDTFPRVVDDLSPFLIIIGFMLYMLSRYRTFACPFMFHVMYRPLSFLDNLSIYFFFPSSVESIRHPLIGGGTRVATHSMRSGVRRAATTRERPSRSGDSRSRSAHTPTTHARRAVFEKASLVLFPASWVGWMLGHMPIMPPCLVALLPYVNREAS